MSIRSQTPLTPPFTLESMNTPLRACLENQRPHGSVEVPYLLQGSGGRYSEDQARNLTISAVESQYQLVLNNLPPPPSTSKTDVRHWQWWRYRAGKSGQILTRLTNVICQIPLFLPCPSGQGGSSSIAAGPSSHLVRYTLSILLYLALL